MKKRKAQLQLSTALLAFLLVNTVTAQDQSFNISWYSYVTPRQEFTRNEVKDYAKIYSVPVLDFAIKLGYSKNLKPNLSWEVGLIGGSYPTDFVVAFDSTFSLYGFGDDDYGIYETSALYQGLSLGASYKYIFSKQHSISIGLAMDLIYFYRATNKYNLTFHSLTGQDFRFLEATTFVNQKRKVIISPTLGLRYSYRVGKKNALFASFNGNYSNQYAIGNGTYKLIGKTETLEGKFKRRYLHAGIEVGVGFDL